MLIFISGSINSGKTTTSKLLAKRLDWPLINVDDLTDKVVGFDIYTHLDLAMDLAIDAINKISLDNKDVVANFVIRKEDYERIDKEINNHPQLFITLSPNINVAQSKRGDRELTEWEIKRVKKHYDEGIASPDYGYKIDNSKLSVEETVEAILLLVMKYSSKNTEIY